MTSLLKRFCAEVKGTAVLYVAVSLPVFFGLAALAIDGGYYYSMKSKAQAAADAAAVAAAITVRDGGTLAAARVRADELVEQNMPTAQFNDVMTDLANDVQFGVWARAANYGSSGFVATGSDPSAVRVTLDMNSSTHNVGLFFVAALGYNQITVGADAVALIVGNSIGDACLVALTTDDVEGALTLGGSGAVDLNGCGAYVNSPNTSAATEALGNKASMVLDPDFYVESFGVWNAKMEGNVFDSSDTDTPDPSKLQRANIPLPDPFALPLGEDPMSQQIITYQSSYGAWDAASGTATWTCGSGLTDFDHNDLTPNAATGIPEANPGVYCPGASGDSLKLTTGDAKLNPGIYVINGGELDINLDSLDATGVSFYLTNGATFSFNGNANTELTAPTDDDNPLKGMVIYQDPDSAAGCAIGAKNCNLMNGTSTFEVDGAVYLPNSPINYSGNTNTGNENNCFIIVAATVYISGNTDMNLNAEACKTGFDLGGPSTEYVRLVE